MPLPMRSTHQHRRNDAATDPFQEETRVPSFGVQLLGGRFRFETRSSQLRQLVKSAYEHLPSHRLAVPPRAFRIKLVLLATDGARSLPTLARPHLFSSAAMLGGATPASNFAVVAPDQRTGIIVVSSAALRHSYEIRYELIEFAVFTLAARVQRLIPLHAACVGRHGRGLILIGDSGAGKSTLTLQCGLNGFELLCEDSLFVTAKTLSLTGVANFLHLRRDSLRFLPADIAALVRNSPQIRRRSGIQKFEIDLRRPPFRLAPAPLRLAGLVFMTGKSSRAGRPIVPLEADEVKRRLEATQPYAAHQEGWPTFMKRMGGIAAYELARSPHPREAVTALKHILAKTSARDAGPSES